jgi:hypothetical protein
MWIKKKKKKSKPLVVCGDVFQDRQDRMVCGNPLGHFGKHRGSGEFLGCTWTDAGKRVALAEQAAEAAAQASQSKTPVS